MGHRGIRTNIPVHLAQGPCAFLPFMTLRRMLPVRTILLVAVKCQSFILEHSVHVTIFVSLPILSFSTFGISLSYSQEMFPL